METKYKDFDRLINKMLTTKDERLTSRECYDDAFFDIVRDDDL